MAHYRVKMERVLTKQAVIELCAESEKEAKEEAVRRFHSAEFVDQYFDTNVLGVTKLEPGTGAESQT